MPKRKNDYKNVTIGKAVGEPSVSKERIEEVVQKVMDEDTSQVKMTFYVPESISKAIRILAVELEKDYSEVAVDAFVKHLLDHRDDMGKYFRLVEPHLQT